MYPNDTPEHPPIPSPLPATPPGHGNAGKRPSTPVPGWGFVALVLVVGVLAGFGIAFLLLAPSGGLLRPESTVYDERLVTSLYERVSPSVVEVNIDRVGVSPGRVFNATDSGSGFFIDNEGHILTNYHVISVGDEIRVTLADGRVLPATKLGTSPADDLALLQVDPDEVRDIVPLILADSDQIKTGQLAIAIGSPFGLDNYLSVGVVAGYGEGPALTSRPVPKMVWTNAQLLPGNSGGPLIDSKGAVIGIATAVQVGAGGELGLGFAIPSNIVGDLLSDLVIPQEIKRAWLGISGETLTKDLSDALGLVVDKGVYVTRVWPDSPAEGIGMRDDPFTFSLRRLPSGRGDIIVAADARPIASLSEMVEYFNTLRPGNTVRLTVIRGGGQPFDVDVTLEAWSPGG